MANATLTLSISGTVAGKTVSFSQTQTVDNIDTVIQKNGQIRTGSSLVTLAATGATATPIAEQDHDMLMISNAATRGTFTTNVVTASGTIIFHLEPGAFVVLQKATAGGVINESTTATTTTMVSTTNIELTAIMPGLSAPEYGILGCYNYAS